MGHFAASGIMGMELAELLSDRTRRMNSQVCRVEFENEEESEEVGERGWGRWLAV